VLTTLLLNPSAASQRDTFTEDASLPLRLIRVPPPGVAALLQLRRLALRPLCSPLRIHV
jgi:hypothetical protein